MNEAKKELTAITSKLLNPDSTFGEVFQAVKEYKSLLLNATSLDFGDMETEASIYTDSGKAIGPRWASLCVDDTFRTQKFCRGLLKAVQQKREENPTRKVHILYAGTGPFATLALPLTTFYSSEEISFTFLEINELSIKGLRETIAYFEIEDYVRLIEKTDATTYKLKNNKEIDIVIIEAMMFSLKGEHQVPISYNLISQLSNDVVLIPQEISLNLLAVNSERRHANKQSLGDPIPYFEPLGTLFKLSKEEIYKQTTLFFETFPETEFPENKIEIPNAINRNFNELHVETKITIFKDEVLQIDESGLTTLDKFHEFKSMMRPAKYLVSTYMCGRQPGLYFRFEN